MAGLVDMLAQPITQLLGSLGTGVLPSGGPADALRASSAAIDSVHSMGRAGMGELDAAWRGKAADTAVHKAGQVQKSAGQIADRGTDIAQVVTFASAEVNACTRELEGILQSFLTTAAAAGPTLFTPPGLLMIMGVASEHLQRALAVVAKTRAKLDEHTAAMAALGPPPDQVPAPVATEAPAVSGAPQVSAAAAPSATAPAGADPLGQATGVAQAVSSAFSEGTSSSGSMLGHATHNAHGGHSSAALAPGHGSPGERALAGQGVRITLPDGSTALAPNEKAANAVRAALTQRGVPYVWGGTSPGQGLDCSGLTKYAYGQAGVELPRLAQDQGHGHTAVDVSDVMPGDLAVWSGHVAMVIGNGQMIEAGDPVSVSAIRTENSGMNFQGFYRPTE